MRKVLHTPDDRRTWAAYLYQQPLPVTVSIREGLDRSTEQNALAFKWFTEVGHQTGEGVDEVRCRAKLDIGCVILCRDDLEFLSFCKDAMGHMNREARLKAMRWVPVTRLMTVKQMSEFLDQFERMHRAQGLSLTTPEERTAQ